MGKRNLNPENLVALSSIRYNEFCGGFSLGNYNLLCIIFVYGFSLVFLPISIYCVFLFWMCLTWWTCFILNFHLPFLFKFWLFCLIGSLMLQNVVLSLFFVSYLHSQVRLGFTYLLFFSKCRFIKRIFLCQPHTWFAHNRYIFDTKVKVDKNTCRLFLVVGVSLLYKDIMEKFLLYHNPVLILLDIQPSCNAHTTIAKPFIIYVPYFFIIFYNICYHTVCNSLSMILCIFLDFMFFRYPSYCGSNIWPRNSLPELELGMPWSLKWFCICSFVFLIYGDKDCCVYHMFSIYSFCINHHLIQMMIVGHKLFSLCCYGYEHTVINLCCCFWYYLLSVYVGSLQAYRRY